VDLQRDVPFRGGVDNAAHLWDKSPTKSILGTSIGIFKLNTININKKP